MEDIGVPQEYIDSTPETSLQEFGDTLVELVRAVEKIAA